MKKKYYLVFIILLFACGEPSTQTVIPEKESTQPEPTIVETVTTVPQTTTSTVTTLVLPTKRSYEDSVLKFNQYLLVDQFDSTVFKDSYYIRLKSKWNRVNILKLIFDNECETWKRPDTKEQTFPSVIGININNGRNPCIEANEIIAIHIEGISDTGKTRFTTFYKNGYYTSYQYDKNHIENGSVASCCHKIDFIKINLELKMLKNILINPTTTTSTTTTLPKYILPKIKIPSCPDSYSMPSALVNLSINYSLIAGSSEIVSFKIERYDVQNGNSSLNSETYDKQQAINAGIALPKNTNEEANIKSTFLIKNQNERRNFIFRIIATDDQGKSSSKECEFIINPNGTEVVGDNESPVWGNDPISFSKVNSSYLDILWGQATDNTGISIYKIYANGVLKNTINFGTNRTTIVGLVPNTDYLFEIVACDAAGNCSSNNPTASKKTPGSNSSNNIQNVGPIPENIFKISFLNRGFGWGGSFLYTYPKNIGNSKPVALEFLNNGEDTCESINFAWSNGNHIILDTIWGGRPTENCSRFALAGTQGVNFTILFNKEFVKWNDPGLNDFEKLCGVFELQFIEIQNFDDTYLTYTRNGILKYFENSLDLMGQGTHNLDLSLLDINVMDGGANYGYGDC